MPEETLVLICPNPKCQREIKEPITIQVLSTTPVKEYQACPYCFSKLEQERPLEKDDMPETTIDDLPEPEMEQLDKEEETEVLEERSKFLSRVKSLIPKSDESQKDEVEDSEFEVDEEESPAQKITEAIRNVTKPKEETQEAKECSGCPESFGYLANRPSNAPIPQQCMLCPKIVDCMLKVAKD